MATAAEHLERIAPFLFEPADPRYVDPDIIAWGLAVALEWRPACGGDDWNNLGHARRAAYEILSIARADATSANSSTTVEVGVAGALVEEQQGDVRRRYSDGKTTTGVSSTTGANQGPSTFYAQWKEMWDRCSGVIEGQEPPKAVRRGGIITRYGIRS